MGKRKGGERRRIKRKTDKMEEKKRKEKKEEKVKKKEEEPREEKKRKNQKRGLEEEKRRITRERNGLSQQGRGWNSIQGYHIVYNYYYGYKMAVWSISYFLFCLIFFILLLHWSTLC